MLGIILETGVKQKGGGKSNSRGGKRNKRGKDNANRKERKNRNLTRKKGNWGGGKKRNWKGKKKRNPSRGKGKQIPNSMFIKQIQNEHKMIRSFDLISSHFIINFIMLRHYSHRSGRK